MSLPLALRKQAIDEMREKLALVKATGTATQNYFFDLSKQGIKDKLKKVADIKADEIPWVAVVGGDHTFDPEAPVNMGRTRKIFDLVVWAIVKPDETRFRGISVANLAELLIADIEKVIELNPLSIDCAGHPHARCTLDLDPLGSYAFIEYVMTYRMHGTLGE